MQSSCSQILTLPQYKGRCWFNAIMTAVFYSQHMRTIMLPTIKRQLKPKGDIFNVFWLLLTSRYKGPVELYEHDEEFFKTFDHDWILYNLHLHDPRYFVFDPLQSNAGYFHEWYLGKFLRFLGLRVLEVDKMPNGELVHSVYNRPHYTKMEKTEKGENEFWTIPYDRVPNIDIQKEYDVIVLHVDHELFNRNFTTKLQSFGQLGSIREKLQFGNDTYILDSCLLVNFNINNNIIGGHVITGLTCEDDRYVYNGWLQNNTSPCRLMKYDWLLTKDNNFCLNTKLCMLNKAIDDSNFTPNVTKILCFDFGKGRRTYLYVNERIASVKPCSPGYEIAPSAQGCVPICKRNEYRSRTNDDCKPLPTGFKQYNAHYSADLKDCPKGFTRDPKDGRCVPLFEREISEIPKKEVVKRVTIERKPLPKQSKTAECPDGKEVNPLTGRCVQKCKANQIRNTSTGRCILNRNVKDNEKRVNKKKVSFECPPEKEMNPATNRCVNKCKEHQYRNPDTRRCVNKNAKRK